MTVLVPYTATGLRMDTVTAVSRHVPAGIDVVWRELDPADPTAYARLLVEAWATPGDLVVVEHDVVIGPGVIEGFTACGEPWCGHPYAIGEQLLVCLGCTRFTAGLKAAMPDLMAAAAAVDTGGLPAGDWRRLDVRIGDLLEAHGHNRHPHDPPVTHLHEYP